MRPEQERVRQLLTEAVSLLCRNSLQYTQTVKVEGLIGITIDERDIFLVSIQEGINKANVSRKRENNESNSHPLATGPSPKIFKKAPSNKKPKSSESDTSQIVSHQVEKVLPTDIQIKSERASPERISESLENENIKTEDVKTIEDDNLDGRNIHPAYDESEFKLNSELEESPLQEEDASNVLNSTFKNPVTNERLSNPEYLPDVSNIKEETNEDDINDECFVIDSEDESCKSQFLNNTLGEAQLINSHHWQDNMDLSGSFGLPDSELFSSSQLSNLMQFSPQPGSSNSYYSPDNKLGISQQSLSDGKFDVRKLQLYCAPPKRRRGNPNIRCQVCGDTFVRTRNLKRHMYRKHYKKQFHCFCGKEYGLLEDLNSHQKLTHHYEYVNGTTESLSIQYKKYIEAMAAESYRMAGNNNIKSLGTIHNNDPFYKGYDTQVLTLNSDTDEYDSELNATSKSANVLNKKEGLNKKQTNDTLIEFTQIENTQSIDYSFAAYDSVPLDKIKVEDESRK